MGRARDLFKKIVDINETFDARMGMVQDRRGKDLTEAENLRQKKKKTPGQKCERGSREGSQEKKKKRKIAS